jgi:hypothetical protein
MSQNLNTPSITFAALIEGGSYLISDQSTIILQDIQNSCHLAENQYTGIFFLEFRKQFVEQDHLATVLPQMWAVSVRRARLCAVKEVRMIAHLAKLHCQ